MKLFHTENGKELVYVQMQDIMHLNNTDMPIPASIYTKVFTGIVIVNDSNRFDFVRFDEEHEVKFFRELDFVIDYDQYKDLTDEQLDEEGNKIATKANVPIVACVLNNTQQIPKNLNIRKTEVDFKIVDVLYPEQFEGMNTTQIGDMLYEKMNTALNEIRNT